MQKETRLRLFLDIRTEGRKRPGGEEEAEGKRRLEGREGGEGGEVGQREFVDG